MAKPKFKMIDTYLQIKPICDELKKGCLEIYNELPKNEDGVVELSDGNYLYFKFEDGFNSTTSVFSVNGVRFDEDGDAYFISCDGDEVSMWDCFESDYELLHDTYVALYNELNDEV